jgi:hypothetical protein
MHTASMPRRRFLKSAASLLAGPALAEKVPQRAVVLMCDGFGLEYLEASQMAILARWCKGGFWHLKNAILLKSRSPAA